MAKLTTKASIKSIRVTPRKMGVVAALVRGRSAQDAATILEHTPRRAAKPLAKLLKSAVANAENNHNAKTDSLTIERLEVGFSERGKRYRPAAHGRALPYQLKHSRVTIVLSGEEKSKKKASAKSTTKQADEAKEVKKTDSKKSKITKKDAKSTKETA